MSDKFITLEGLNPLNPIGKEMHFYSAEDWWNFVALQLEIEKKIPGFDENTNTKGGAMFASSAVAVAIADGSAQALFDAIADERCFEDDATDEEIQAWCEKYPEAWIEVAKSFVDFAEASGGYVITLHASEEEPAKDDLLPWEWCALAAEQGNVDAQFSLGEMYYLGKNVTQDFDQAMLWCTRAAEQGHKEAQSLLGVMYYNGEGVSQNVMQAYAWLFVGSLGSDEDMEKFRDAIASRLTPQEMAEVQEMAAALMQMIEENKSQE